jgi:hypothetical protein
MPPSEIAAARHFVRAGDVQLPAGANTVYTPLLTNLHLHYYNVRMEGVTVGGAKLALDAVRRGRRAGLRHPWCRTQSQSPAQRL